MNMRSTSIRTTAPPRTGNRMQPAPPAGATIATADVDRGSAVACPLQVGGVTVHHPRTLHYTGPNQTADWRRVWNLHFGAYGRLRMRHHPKKLAERIKARHS